MEINLPGLDTQMQPNQLVIKDGLWSETSIVDGGQGGSVGIREAIQRELEKERIREEILAEEVARKRVLEAEVRREIMMEMAMYGRREFPSSLIMLGPSPIIHNNRLDPGMPRGQPSATVSFGEKSGGHHREIGGVVVVPFRPLIKSPREGKQKVTDLGKANGATVCVAEGSREWSCAVCAISATSEQRLNEHLVGKKHKAKMASLKAHDSAEIGMPSKRKRSEEKEAKKCDYKSDVFWCEMCDVGPCSESVMEEHKRGKKRMKKLDKEFGTKKEAEKAGQK